MAADDEAVSKWGSVLERSSWLLVFIGMMTQVSTEYAFPSYNVVLGFWGAYCAFGRHGRATFGLLTFSFFGIVLDIVFCSTNNGPSSAFQFALIMFIFCLLIKVYVLFCGAVSPCRMPAPTDPLRHYSLLILPPPPPPLAAILRRHWWRLRDGAKLVC